MNHNNFCDPGGYLIGGKDELPEDPSDYQTDFDGRSSAAVTSCAVRAGQKSSRASNPIRPTASTFAAVGANQ